MYDVSYVCTYARVHHDAQARVQVRAYEVQALETSSPTTPVDGVKLSCEDAIVTGVPLVGLSGSTVRGGGDCNPQSFLAAFVRPL
jgi:hypothetical protein